MTSLSLSISPSLPLIRSHTLYFTRSHSLLLSCFFLFCLNLQFCLPPYSLLVHNSASHALVSFDFNLAISLSLSIFMFPQFAPTHGQSFSSLIVLPVASPPSIAFYFSLFQSLSISSPLISLRSDFVSYHFRTLPEPLLLISSYSS